MWNWLLHQIGVRPLTGSGAYAFWSGFGSDLGEVAIVGSILSVYVRHKCKDCWRPALKGNLGQVDGTHYFTCHKHTTKENHERLKKIHRVLHPNLSKHLEGHHG